MTKKKKKKEKKMKKAKDLTTGLSTDVFLLFLQLKQYFSTVLQ